MDQKAPRFPIVILGMHRSGTSMLSRFLRTLGLFVGHKLNENHEAVFFRRINAWFLRLGGASWDAPEDIHYLLQQQEVRTLAREYARCLLDSPRSMQYLGLRNYMRFRSLFRLTLPWGWKDPRTTYTLPIWLELFPDAKVVHVYRNGVDVANSLRTRSQRQIEGFRQWLSANRFRHRYRERSFPEIVTSIRCLDLQEGFLLWQKYTDRVEEHLATLAPARRLTVRYESFLKEPETHLTTLCDFCELEVAPEAITELATQVDTSRRKAFERHPDLRDFYESVKHAPQMVRYGY